MEIHFFSLDCDDEDLCFVCIAKDVLGHQRGVAVGADQSGLGQLGCYYSVHCEVKQASEVVEIGQGQTVQLACLSTSKSTIDEHTSVSAALSHRDCC